MIDLNVTFFIQLANFLIFLVLLNHILIKPMVSMLQKRRTTMEGSAAQVQSTDELVARKKAEYEDALAQAKKKPRIMPKPSVARHWPSRKLFFRRRGRSPKLFCSLDNNRFSSRWKHHANSFPAKLSRWLS